MYMQHAWHSFDERMRAKFHGQYGEAAFREAVKLAFMGVAHKLIKARINPGYHRELNLAWYGSLLANHPMHRLRIAVETKIADIAEACDDHFGRPIQHKFVWFDRKVPELEDYIDRLLE